MLAMALHASINVPVITHGCPTYLFSHNTLFQMTRVLVFWYSLQNRDGLPETEPVRLHISCDVWQPSVN